MDPELKECRELLGESELTDDEIIEIRNTLAAIAAKIFANLTQEGAGNESK
jgi:hypothetical protein